MYKYCNVGGEWCLINILSPKKFKMTKKKEVFSYFFNENSLKSFFIEFHCHRLSLCFRAFVVASQEESKSEKASETRQKIDKIASLHVCDFFICSSRRTKNNTQVSARRKIIRTRGKKFSANASRVSENVYGKEKWQPSRCVCEFFHSFS